MLFLTVIQCEKFLKESLSKHETDGKRLCAVIFIHLKTLGNVNIFKNPGKMQNS